MADTTGPGAEAIRAAAQVLYSRFARLTHTSGNEMNRMQDAAQAALSAAWPLLRAEAQHCPAFAAQAAAAERAAIAANLEAEAETGSWPWQAKDALRSFARRLVEMGDADLLDGAESNAKPLSDPEPAETLPERPREAT